MSGKFIISLVALHAYLGQLFFLNKELQAEKINWTDVMFKLTRTRESLDNLDDNMLFLKSQEVCSKLGVSLCLNIAIHSTRSATANAESELSHVKNTLKTLNDHLKLKVNEEFDVRFDRKIIEVMKCIKCFDAGDSTHYLDYQLLKEFADYFSCIKINMSVLKFEIERAKLDLNLGVPINPNRAENLLKLMTVKNTIATSTASVERAFSGMNRICSKLRTKVTSDRLSDLFCVSMNKDILNGLDINNLIIKWAAAKNIRIVI